ncbi:MAG: GAF domain-containing protein, partial [Flavobacteriaceae bacterium]|nr:GAF domain-containing protein [Flavobacteriaceae bacterium]
RLFNETEQRSAELAVINSVQEGLASEMDLQGIYDLVGNKIKELFDSQVAIISTFNHEKEIETFNYVFEDGKRFYLEPIPFDNIRIQLIKTQKLIHIKENATQAFKKFGIKDKALEGTKEPKTMLYVPLVIGDTVRGYVSLQNLDKENAFSDSDVRLLSTLANSMSVALENARLFNETEQRNAELAVINSVQEGLVAEMDMQGIYDLVGDRIRDLFDAQVAAIATFDHEHKTETFQYIYENGERLNAHTRPFDKIRQRLINTKKLINVSEDAKEAFTTITGKAPTAVPGTKFPKSMLFVPLLLGDDVRGYVSLQNLDREHAFSDSDVRLLGTLANSMSVALENARLFNETEQRNAELAVITSVQEGLVAEMDMQGIYDLVGEKIRQLFDAQVTAIASFDHKQELEIWHYLFEDGDRLYPPNRKLDKLRKKVIKERKSLLLSENAAEEISRINGKPHKPVPGTRAAMSALLVPMLVGDNVLGYVTLQNLDRNNAFSESDVRLLTTLVNSMSVAIENARLFNQTTRLLSETEQRNAELAVINSVQEGLVREMDMNAIYHLVGSRICEVLNTQTLIIRTFNHDSGFETWEFAIENGKQLVSKPRPLIWANKHLIKSKEPLLINENYVETAKKHGDKNKGVSKGLAPKSAIFVPMIVGDVVMGSVSLQNVEKENAFTESDVRLLSTLTFSMSVALENARLFNETTRLLDETEQRASELQTVNNISIAMVSQLEFDALIKLVGEQMRETFKADIVYLALHDRKTNMLHFPYIYGDTSESRAFSNGITEKIILNKKPLLINENIDEVTHKIKAEHKGETVQSFLGVPIIIGKRAIGVISVQSKESENRFNEYDERLLTTIAANLGIAIQNAEAYQKLQAALTELRAAQEQLVQSEKMASLGELTAGIAHEIQNPLNFVNNFSEVSEELLEELKDEVKENINEEIIEIISDLKQNLGKITHHGKRASSIVKGMLDHSRTSNGIKVFTDINILADEYLRLSYHGLRAKDRSFSADFKTDLDNSLPKVSVVPQDFGRVILNLINNAFYAVSKKGKEAPESYQPTVTVRTKKIEKAIEISVKDKGEGISKDIADKIFQPFFTTKPSGEGTGLGLSLAYDIVTKGHGGQLKLSSKKGEFTEFTIVLPI